MNAYEILKTFEKQLGRPRDQWSAAEWERVFKAAWEWHEYWSKHAIAMQSTAAFSLQNATFETIAREYPAEITPVLAPSTHYADKLDLADIEALEDEAQQRLEKAAAAKDLRDRCFEMFKCAWLGLEAPVGAQNKLKSRAAESAKKTRARRRLAEIEDFIRGLPWMRPKDEDKSDYLPTSDQPHEEDPLTFIWRAFGLMAEGQCHASKGGGSDHLVHVRTAFERLSADQIREWKGGPDNPLAFARRAFGRRAYMTIACLYVEFLFPHEDGRDSRKSRLGWFPSLPRTDHDKKRLRDDLCKYLAAEIRRAVEDDDDSQDVHSIRQ